MSSAERAMKYTTTLGPLQGSKARVPVPFDPDEVWGTKREHHIGGTIAGVRVRGSIGKDDGGWGFSVSLRERPISAGDVVDVVISPEGPQRWDLQPDFRAALEASPDAGAFFDSLAQFYRKGYLRWIDATKRRPDVRAERIAEVVRLLSAGVKERPSA
jgi:Bacteriocin-protection, YdeI or OmpD-Associated